MLPQFDSVTEGPSHWHDADLYHFLVITLAYRHSVAIQCSQGSFGVEDDREKVAEVLRQAIRKSLFSWLRRGKLAQYRLLLNLQSVYLRSWEPDLQDVVPGFQASGVDPKLIDLERFLFQNGFRHALERDAVGWSPLCYAVLQGNASLVAALLEQQANPNDQTRRSNPDVYVAGHTPVLVIGARFQNHKAMKVLITAQADIEGRDSFGSTPLVASAVSSDAVGAQLLCEAGANTDVKNMFGVSVCQIACEANALGVMRELRSRSPNLSLAGCVQSACAVHGSTALLKWLVNQRADINEQYKPPAFSLLGFLMRVKGAQYRFGFSRTMLSFFAYHHYGASALMSAILTGNFEAAAALVAMKARLDLRNSRGKTAKDLANDMAVPPYLVELLDQPTGALGLTSMEPLRSFGLAEFEREESDCFEI